RRVGRALGHDGAARGRAARRRGGHRVLPPGSRLAPARPAPPSLQAGHVRASRRGPRPPSPVTSRAVARSVCAMIAPRRLASAASFALLLACGTARAGDGGGAPGAGGADGTGGGTVIDEESQEPGPEPSGCAVGGSARGGAGA